MLYALALSVRILILPDGGFYLSRNASHNIRHCKRAAVIYSLFSFILKICTLHRDVTCKAVFVLTLALEDMSGVTPLPLCLRQRSPPPPWEAGWSLSRGVAMGEEMGGASAWGGKINILMENRLSVRNWF